MFCTVQYLKEGLSFGSEDERGDAHDVLLLDARRLDDLATQVRQRVDGQVTLVRQASETVLRVTLVGLQNGHT